MRSIKFILALCALPALLGGCAVVTVAGAAVSVGATAVGVGVSAASAAVGATASVVKGAASLASDDEETEKK